VRDSARTKAVRLPRGSWMDWWTGETVDGGRTVTADAPLDRIPLYQKAGTIVPMRPVRMHVEAQPADTLLLSVVPERPSEANPSPKPAAFTLYEDDGATLNYQRGAYALTRITHHATADALTLTVGAASGTYDGLPAERTVRATVHRVASAPHEVRVGDRTLPERTTQADLERDGGYRYDADRNALILQTRLPTHTAHTLHVRTTP
jgi:alpha-glucosidase (family GH31 glycosyl hydrolase)